MRCIKKIDEIRSERQTAVTLGKFDGFHRGHQKLLFELCEAKKQGCLSVVFTFDAPPKACMDKELPKALLSSREKCDLAEKLQADWLIVCPFTDRIRNMTAERFVKEILAERLHAKKIVTGVDFRFGYQRSGDVDTLRDLSKIYGYELTVLEKERDGGQVISSTLIRERLAQGDMERVNRLLGYPFHVTGEIIHGAQLGRTIGMPTINLLPGADKLLPPNGVYASAAEIEGKIYQGVTNIGYKPTVSGRHVCGVETYLLDTSGDFYGKTARVYLYAFQRPEQKFGSVEELTAQMRQDAKQAEAYMRKYAETSRRIKTEICRKSS